MGKMNRYRFKALIFIFFAYSVSANNLRMLNEVKTDQFYPCVEDITQGTCACPGSCMELVYNNTECRLKNCYSWNKELNKCEEVGPAFVSAIVLQAIPVTGIFGAGFGNMGRWDIFNIYMAVVFGPFAILLLACCCAMCGACSQNEDRADCAKCMGACCSCLWSIAIVSLWIWGIVVIANKEITGPPQIWYNETVSCSLVG